MNKNVTVLTVFNYFMLSLSLFSISFKTSVTGVKSLHDILKEGKD